MKTSRYKKPLVVMSYGLLFCAIIFLSLTSCSENEDETGSEPIENQEKKLAVGLNKGIGLPIIQSVYIDNTLIPLTLLNSTTTHPDCSSANSYVILPEALNTNSNGIGKFYFVKVTYSRQGSDGVWYTQTDTMAINDYHFISGCNIYQVLTDASNRITIVKMK